MNNEKFIENKLMAKNLTPEWQEVIDAVKEKHEGTLKGDFIRMRYEEKKNPIPIYMSLHIGQSTFYEWRKEVIHEVMLQAAYKQLFKP